MKEMLIVFVVTIVVLLFIYTLKLSINWIFNIPWTAEDRFEAAHSKLYDLMHSGYDVYDYYSHYRELGNKVKKQEKNGCCDTDETYKGLTSQIKDILKNPDKYAKRRSSGSGVRGSCG